jgi:hypothetical protein
MREVVGSNSGRDIGYTDMSTAVFLSPHNANTGIAP